MELFPLTPLAHRAGGVELGGETIELAKPAPHNGARLVGVLLLAAAAWGGIVAFVGPTFDFVTATTRSAWVWSDSHATLNLAPSLAGILGACLLLAGPTRGLQRLGALLALTAGVWFVLGPSLEPLWRSAAPGAFETSGSRGMRALEALGYQYGTGVLMITLAAASLALPAGRAPAPDPVDAKQPARGHRRRVTMRHASHA